jgi:signal transduction histidine kinase
MSDGSPTRPGSSGTHFLPAARAAPERLAREIARAAESPLISALLQATGTAAVVLDPTRQIVAVNARYLELVGVRDPARMLGLRPGEALDCVYAGDAPGGCGTSRACPSCGTALAILVAQQRGRIETRRSVLAIGGRAPASHGFVARAAPVELDGQRFALLTLEDVSAERRRVRLGRVFAHDLSNLAAGLHSAAEELGACEGAEGAHDLRTLSEQLVRTVQLERALSSERVTGYRAAPEPVPLEPLVDLLVRSADRHPSAAGRRIEVRLPEDHVTIVTDRTLVHHVVSGMLVNALEATRPGGGILLEAMVREEAIAFRVWNAGAIPAAVVPRVFQRYFSTKDGAGRGQGTYAMKRFGEAHLGGAVSFATSARDGTWFELRLPSAVRPAAGPGEPV